MRFLALLATLLLFAVPSALAERVTLGPDSPINGMSGPFEACPTMTFAPEGLNTGSVSIYALAAPSPLLATVEAGDLIAKIDSTSADLTTTVPHDNVYVVVDTVETSGRAGLEIGCVDAVDGVKVVNSFAEMNAYFRTLDKTPSETETITAFVTLGAGFEMDKTSTTTETVWLPVGGGEHPRITIDLGEHIIANEADPVLTIRFGNQNGECAVSTYSGYNRSTEDCNGVAHDYQFTLQNGMVTTLTEAGEAGFCSPYPTTACDRTMLLLEDVDRLFYTGGGRYNGRSRLINLKLGGAADNTDGGEGAPGNTYANGDECVSISAYSAELLIDNSYLECMFGVTFTDIDDSGGVSITSTVGGRHRFNKVSAFTFPITSSTDYQLVNGGFFRHQDDMSGASFVGDIFLYSGTLGKTRGGFFDLSVQATSTGPLDIPGGGDFLGECYDENDVGATVSFLDNATLAGTDEPIQGIIRFSGIMCVQNWLWSDATGTMRFDSHVGGGINDLYPAFYEPDNVDTSRDGFVMRVDAGATFTGGVEFNFTFEDAITTDPASSHDGTSLVAWDDIVDPQIDAGTGFFDNDYEYVSFQMGARGKRTDAGTSGTDTIVSGPIYGP